MGESEGIAVTAEDFVDMDTGGMIRREVAEGEFKVARNDGEGVVEVLGDAFGSAGYGLAEERLGGGGLAGQVDESFWGQIDERAFVVADLAAIVTNRPGVFEYVKDSAVGAAEQEFGVLDLAFVLKDIEYA